MKSHCQSGNLVYTIHTSSNLLVNQKRLTAHKLLKRLESPNLGSLNLTPSILMWLKKDTLNWGTLGFVLTH